MGQIRTLADIEEIERVPLAERQLPQSTYAMIRQSALTFPDRCALIFFPDGEHYQASLQVTYRQLLGRIHQVANMLSDLGIGCPISRKRRTMGQHRAYQQVILGVGEMEQKSG